MKRFVYITSFTLLGVLLATLLHATIEIPVLKTITGDLGKYGNTFLWQHWVLIHGIVSVTLWFLGAGLGIWLGFHFWRILYVEMRYGKPRF